MFFARNKTFIIINLILIFLSSGVNGLAKDWAPGDLKNPNIENRTHYVADPADLVDAATENEINRILDDVRKRTSAEVVAVIVPSIGDMPIEEFSEKLFTSWGIGKSDKDNGVLILIDVGGRQARITTGYGVEGIIPDIAAKRIIDKAIVPAMKNGEPGKALLDAAQTVGEALSDPEVAAELKSKKEEPWLTQEGSDISADDVISLLLTVVLSLFVVSCFLYIYDSRTIRKRERYDQALAWHSRRSTYMWLAIGSLGLGIIPFLLAERKRKKTRNTPISCPTCGTKMEKLDEETDNNYLTPSQDFEERLKTVDYDVWLCPRCGSVESFPFKVNQNKYTECPACHTTAMTMIRNHTLVPATTRMSGVGEKIYECKYCHHKKRDHYTIPRRQDAAAAGAAAGSLLGRGGGFRGGSGGFGGGFGGGHTGGGGASGRW